MATGPEHYRKAEAYLTTWMHSGNAESLGGAQVHAILALAAATALCGSPDGELDDSVAWERAAGEFSARRARELRADLDAARKPAADVDPVTGRDYAEEAWQRAEAEREGREELAAEQAETATQDAPDFRVGDLVNVSQPKHPHWGTRGKIVGFTDDVPALVAVEYDNLGNCLYLAPSQLMHHTDFVKQSDEYFDAAEAADVRSMRHDMAIEAGDDHDPATCTECADQYEAEQAEDSETMNDPASYTAAQLAGEACTVCGDMFAIEEHGVPTGAVDGGQLFAHADCLESEAAKDAEAAADAWSTAEQAEHDAACDFVADYATESEA